MDLFDHTRDSTPNSKAKSEFCRRLKYNGGLAVLASF